MSKIKIGNINAENVIIGKANFVLNEEDFKNALLEAAKWEDQATEFERSKIPMKKSRERVINRIFNKYNPLSKSKEVLK